MRLLAIKNSDECDGCWGVYSKFGCERQKEETDINKVCRVKWFVNTGLAFNASIHRAIEKSDFDEFRDGWDWSIYHLIQTVSSPRISSPLPLPRHMKIVNV